MVHGFYLHCFRAILEWPVSLSIRSLMLGCSVHCFVVCKDVLFTVSGPNPSGLQVIVFYLCQDIPFIRLPYVGIFCSLFQDLSMWPSRGVRIFILGCSVCCFRAISVWPKSHCVLIMPGYSIHCTFIRRDFLFIVSRPKQIRRISYIVRGFMLGCSFHCGSTC